MFRVAPLNAADALGGGRALQVLAGSVGRDADGV